MSKKGTLMNSINFSGSYSAKINSVNRNNKKRNIKKAVLITAGVTAVAGGAIIYAHKKPDTVQKLFNNIKGKFSELVQNLKPKQDIKTPVVNKPVIPALQDKSIGRAKEGAKNLRLTSAAAAGGGVIFLVDNLAAENEEENNKTIIKYNNKKFKGEIRDGKAYDEDNNPFTGELSVVYKNDDNTKNTKITYENGVLVQAVHYDKNEGEIPVFVKDYENGYITRLSTDLVQSADGGRELIPQKILRYNTEEESPFPMLSIEKTFSDTGVELENKVYKRNLDSENKIAGKPIHKWSVKYETLSDGTKRNTFYPAEELVFENKDTDEKLVLRQPVKIVDAKPDGTTEVTLMSREGYPLGKMFLNKEGKAVSYRLIVEPEKGDYDGNLDGIIRLKDGKIKGMNDFMSVLKSLQNAIAPPKPVVLDNPELSEIKTKEKKRAFAQKLSKLANSRCRLNDATNYNQNDINRVLSSNYSTRKIGIRYNENGTVRAIALYSSYDDFPDCVTLFNDDGTPQKDINYTGNGMEQSFSPVYQVRGRA